MYYQYSKSNAVIISISQINFKLTKHILPSTAEGIRNLKLCVKSKPKLNLLRLPNFRFSLLVFSGNLGTETVQITFFFHKILSKKEDNKVQELLLVVKFSIKLPLSTTRIIIINLQMSSIRQNAFILQPVSCLVINEQTKRLQNKKIIRKEHEVLPLYVDVVDI